MENKEAMHLSRASTSSNRPGARATGRGEKDDDEDKDDDHQKRRPSDGGNDSIEDGKASSDDDDDEETYDPDNADAESQEGKAESGGGSVGETATLSSAGGPHDMTKMRREKRLAMNRASARARRKRKKVLLDSLANQVTELTKHNQAAKLTNDTLRARVEQLGSALTQAQATIASLLSGARQQSTLTQQFAAQQQRQASELSTAAVAAAAGHPSHQDSLQSLFQAAIPSFNQTSLLMGGASFGERLAQQELLNASLLARGQQQQQTQNQIYDAVGLGGTGSLNLESLGAIAASPIGSFLGQFRRSEVLPQGGSNARPGDDRRAGVTKPEASVREREDGDS